MNDVRLFEGEDAWSLLESPAFQKQWDALHSLCPWATPFQARGFADTWYRTYRVHYRPVLAVDTQGAELRGLLAAAIRSDRRLSLAGAHQAEYQAWLSDDSHGSEFMDAAVEVLRRRFSGDLVLKYVPTDAPLDWALGRAVVETVACPILDANADQVTEKLQKKSNKSKLARLRRLGDVHLEVLDTREDLERVIDEIIALYDFRQGAMHAVLPFAQDTRKREFHLALMDAGILHASVYRVGDRIASALMGVASDGYVQNGVIAYNPLFAKHSPMKFHLFELARHLAGAPGACIDLTAGDDWWKDRFATRHSKVHIVRMHSSRVKHYGESLWQAASPMRRFARGSLRRLRRFARPSKNLPEPENAFRSWVGAAENLPIVSRDYGIRVGDLEDLLRLAKKTESTEILFPAMRNLEQGNTVLLSDDVSAPTAWVRKQDGCAVIHQVRSPDPGDADWLSSVLAAAAHSTSTSTIRLQVPERDSQLARAAESLGLSQVEDDSV